MSVTTQYIHPWIIFTSVAAFEAKKRKSCYIPGTLRELDTTHHSICNMQLERQQTQANISIEVAEVYLR